MNQIEKKVHVAEKQRKGQIRMTGRQTWKGEANINFTSEIEIA